MKDRSPVPSSKRTTRMNPGTVGVNRHNELNIFLCFIAGVVRTSGPFLLSFREDTHGRFWCRGRCGNLSPIAAGDVTNDCLDVTGRSLRPD